MLDELAGSTTAIIFAKDAQGRYIFINRGYELVHRVSRETYLGKTDYDVFPKEQADAFREADLQVIETRQPSVAEERHTYQDGSHTVVVVKFALVDAKGDVYGVCGVATDITQRIEAETRMRMLSAAVDQASDMVAMFEWTPLGEWRIFYVNDMFLRMTGYERHDVIGHTSRFLEGPRTNVEESNRRRALLARGIPCRAEVAYYRRDGSVFWVELNARPLRAPDGSVTHTIVLYRDISERHADREMENLESVREEDGGLFSRRYFERSVESAVYDARVNQSTHAVLSIQLGPVAQIAEIANSLSERLRMADVLAHTGPDELGVLLRHCNLAQAQRAAGDFLDAIDAVHAQACIGVCEINAASADWEQVVTRAKEACTRAKGGGPNTVRAAR